MIIVSAPAKVHLMGEHAVVYGKPALLSAVDKRLYVNIGKAKNNKLKIVCQQPDHLVRYCLKLIKKSYHLSTLPPMEIAITSNIPSNSGLGSSAALAVATLAALHLYLKKGWNTTKINELAYEVEKRQHGNPSGGDNTVVTFGGFLYFRKEFEFLKSIWQLPIRMDKKAVRNFFLIDSGRPKESTKEMIERVNAKCTQIMSLQEELTKRMVVALKKADEQELTTTIKQGQRNLERLGVVGKRATSMIRIIEAKGGAAKITGAGGIKTGSGMLLCYHPQSESLAQLAKEKQWLYMPVRLGEEGVRREV